MGFLTDFPRDVAHGIRLLARYRGFSATAVAILAIAIGGNTAVFTIVNALLLTPPPVLEPARLARIDTGQSLASWTTYRDIRESSDAFTDVAAAKLTSLGLGDGDTGIRLRGQTTSTNYLSVLGVAPTLGRGYGADETQTDRVILAHHVWRQHFSADAGIVGKSVVLGGRSLEVVGVMPAGFRALVPPGVRLDFWMPRSLQEERASAAQLMLPEYQIVGRLRPGATYAAATASLRSVAPRLRQQRPDLPESFLTIEAGSIEGVHAFQGMASLVLPVFAFLALLTVVSGFVLTIGCTNIAGLLVGRAAMRQREIAVRMSLGSSRGRLLRQLLTESLVLAAAGGGTGLLVATTLVRLVSIGMTALPTPLDLEFAIDRRVLAYVIGLSTATVLLFGLLPARSALRIDLLSSLKTDGSGTPARQRLRRAMVLVQVAASAILVVWSMLFLRSLGRIHAIEPGFDASGIVTATIELDRSVVDPARGVQIVTEWTQRVAESASVQSAAIATVVPLALTGTEEFDVTLPDDRERRRRRVLANRVTPGWFATVRIPVVAGRDFSWNDSGDSPSVAIVNETFARQFWNGDALGQRVLFGDRSLEIVGVSKDSKYRTLGETVRPLIFLPIRQQYARFVTLHARAADLRATGRLMTSELQRLLPMAQPTIESMEDAVAVAVLPARIGAAVTGVFAALALALAACGVYALVAFSVLQRTREIGIRRAVGAMTTEIVGLIVRDHAVVLVIGLVVGTVAGAFSAKLLSGFLAGVGPTDPVALIGVISVVGGAALAASAIPALRVTRVDPMTALRDTY